MDKMEVDIESRKKKRGYKQTLRTSDLEERNKIEEAFSMQFAKL
jgi:hypothetical protein